LERTSESGKNTHDRICQKKKKRIQFRTSLRVRHFNDNCCKLVFEIFTNPSRLDFEKKIIMSPNFCLVFKRETVRKYTISNLLKRTLLSAGKIIITKHDYIITVFSFSVDSLSVYTTRNGFRLKNSAI